MEQLIREKICLYWLSQVPSMGAVTIKRLWDRYHSFEKIYNMEGKELKDQGFLRAGTEADFDSRKGRLREAQEGYRGLEEKGIRFVTILDREYPDRLRPLHGSPAMLYVRGRLPEDGRPSAAVVGARGCSHYGRETARSLARSLAEAGVQVVSGLAEGIDGAGHRGALDAGGDTYGILGCGVDICYPRHHFSMYLEIPERGGVISEFRPGEPPASRNFPMRNRIISGLSDAVIVVEARERSGSLITADCGLEQGKEIFAVPGRTTDALSRGCNELIRQGAGIVTSADDVLDFFRISGEKKLRVHEKNENGLAKNEKMVYSCLDLQPKFIDRVVEESGLALGECLTVLLELEHLTGYYCCYSVYYAKKL